MFRFVGVPRGRGFALHGDLDLAVMNRSGQMVMLDVLCRQAFDSYVFLGGRPTLFAMALGCDSFLATSREASKRSVHVRDAIIACRLLRLRIRLTHFASGWSLAYGESVQTTGRISDCSPAASSEIPSAKYAAVVSIRRFIHWCTYDQQPSKVPLGLRHDPCTSGVVQQLTMAHKGFHHAARPIIIA